MVLFIHGGGWSVGDKWRMKPLVIGWPASGS